LDLTSGASEATLVWDRARAVAQTEVDYIPLPVVHVIHSESADATWGFTVCPNPTN
jgi:hypothetical protein